MSVEATRLSFSYPQEMKDKLIILAKKDCRSLSSYVQMILAEHLDANPVDSDQEEKPEKPTKRKRIRKKSSK